MLNITTNTTAFDYYHSEERGSNAYGWYVWHSAHAYFDITICNQNDCYTITANFSTGQFYNHNDYNCPSNQLELCDDSHEALQIVNQFYDEDFEKEPTEYLLEQFEELHEVLPCIETLEHMHQLYSALMANTPKLYTYLDSTVFTDDLSDYVRQNPENQLCDRWIPKNY